MNVPPSMVLELSETHPPALEALPERMSSENQPSIYHPQGDCWDLNH